MSKKLKEIFPGASQQLNKDWVDPIDCKIIEGHPSMSPYSEREPLWFPPDPFPEWRESQMSKMCFLCGSKGHLFDPYCVGSSTHRDRMKLREWYLEKRGNGTLGYLPQAGWRRVFRW